MEQNKKKKKITRIQNKDKNMTHSPPAHLPLCMCDHKGTNAYNEYMNGMNK